MEYEPKLLVPNIDDHTFTNDEGIDEDGDEDEEQELAVNVGDEMLRPCLMDLVKVGRAKRLRRKRTTTQYIMNRVKSMKEELMVTNIPPEHNDVDDSVWITYLREIRYDYYDD
jgi:hypothetical protein